MANSPRILTLRLKATEDGTAFLIEHGNVELERKIPEGHGLVRMSAIFDNGGRLGDVELITEKLES